MEIAVPDLAGSLGGGGRYDNLVGMFGGQEVPAAGVSLGLERIIVVMTERGMFPPRDRRGTGRRDGGALERGDGRRGARRWRTSCGRPACASTSTRRPTSSASSSSTPPARGVAAVAVMGDDELARREVTVKDLRSGEQTTIARSAAVAHVRALVGR
jgi:histidyl-tRNA synthetase